MSRVLVCADGVGLLMDYLEDAVDAATRAGIDAHLAGCPRCVAFVRSYVATPAILRRATAVAAPPTLGASLRAFLARNR
ncbi:MAG: anti-sigma factor [Vicinamibacteria bacterium]